MTIFLIILAVLCGAIVLYAVLLAAVAKFSVSPPRMPQFVTPGLMGEAHDTVSIKTVDDIVLRAWWVPGDGATTVIFAHGYFTNRCEFVPFVSRFKLRGASCLFFDHRAHGTSQGKRCTFGVEEALDVAAAVDWVKVTRPDDRIVLVGNSMGAVACALRCADEPLHIDALILDSPYCRVGEAARGWWTFFARGKFKGILRPTSIFGRMFSRADLNSLDLEESLGRIRGKPVLMMFGEHDPLISRINTDKCVAAAGPLAEVVWFGDSNHARARFREPERYSLAVFEFLERNGLLRALPEPAPQESVLPKSGHPVGS